MKKLLLILLFLFFIPNLCFGMLKLNEFRELYPEYDDMTDYEVSTAMHRTRYADMPYEQFARLFGGPLVERERAKYTINGVEMSFRRYRNEHLGCSFFYPEDLTYQVEKNNKLLTVYFFDNQFPLMTLTAERITPEISKLFTSLHSSKISDRKFGEKFYSDKNISLATFKKVFVVNNPGLESIYCYHIRHFDTSEYMFIHKLDVVYKNSIRWKLEVITPLCETPKKAKAAHESLDGLIKITLTSFSLD